MAHHCSALVAAEFQENDHFQRRGAPSGWLARVRRADTREGDPPYCSGLGPCRALGRHVHVAAATVSPRAGTRLQER